MGVVNIRVFINITEIVINIIVFVSIFMTKVIIIHQFTRYHALLATILTLNICKNVESELYKLKKWKKEICYEYTTLKVAVNEKTAFIVHHHSSYTAFQTY